MAIDYHGVPGGAPPVSPPTNACLPPYSSLPTCSSHLSLSSHPHVISPPMLTPSSRSLLL
eukprot:3062212-Rhodomonas_salina.2